MVCLSEASSPDCASVNVAIVGLMARVTWTWPATVSYRHHPQPAPIQAKTVPVKSHPVASQELEARQRAAESAARDAGALDPPLV